MSAVPGRSPNLAVSNLLAVRAAQILADRAWHNYEEVVRELMRVVPPGPAVRRAERNRAGMIYSRGGARSRAPESRALPRSTEELIAFGARDFVVEFLNSSTAWQVEAHPGGGRGANRDPRRRVRMVRLPRGAQAHPDRARADELEVANGHLAATVDRLVKFLAELGYGEQAERLREGPLDGQR